MVMVKEVGKNSIADFFVKVKEMFVSPSKFLSSVEKKKDYVDVLKPFFILYFIYFLISPVINLYNGIINWYAFVLYVIYAMIVPIILVFLSAGVIHLGVLIFKGKQKFFNTFKPVSYALVILVVYMYLSLLAFAIVPYSFLDATAVAEAGVDELKQMYNEFLAQPGVIINLIIMVVSLIHFFVFSVKGIAKFQKISKGRAFASIIAGGLLFLAFLTILGILFSLA